ncbi:MAG: DNA-deoxyinosine glycosylase [Burkholderiaceae bacterium]
MSATAPIPVPALTGLPPVVDAATRVLILGSFPGGASLAASRYYAHPRNQFWPLLSAVTGEPLAAQPYDDRLRRLLALRIGLWDVIAGCDRIGSLDSAIRNAQANDFGWLRQTCPTLARVCFNGKTSGKEAPRFAAAGYETLVLPSSSPANAQFSFDAKLAAWRGILAGLG